MDIQSVTEFLGGVPLLNRLPNSSVKELAQLVKLKQYDSGKFIIRKGDGEAGVYFVCEGEAEVRGHEGEEIRQKFLLKRFDYFGHVDLPVAALGALCFAASKIKFECRRAQDEINNRKNIAFGFT